MAFSEVVFLFARALASLRTLAVLCPGCGYNQLTPGRRVGDTTNQRPTSLYAYRIRARSTIERLFHVSDPG